MSYALSLAQTILPLPNDLPASAVKHVTVNDVPYIVYPSGDGIIVLDSSMDSVATLPFSLGFHSVGKGGREGAIGAVAVDRESALIIASLDSHIVVFAPVQPDPTRRARKSPADTRPSWKVHSTMTSPREGPITALDYHKGKLLVSSKGSLALWTSDMDDGMGLWSRAWDETLDVRSSPVACTSFSPSGVFVAVLSQTSKTVQILKINKSGEREGPSTGQTVKFARPVKRIWWRSSSKDPTPLLYSLTGTSAIHIHSPVLDDPNHFQLLATVSPPLSCPPCSALFPLDASQLRKGIQASLVAEPAANPGLRKMLEDIGGEQATLGDLFVGIERESGGVHVWSVLNMESRPPALLKMLGLVHHPSSLRPIEGASPSSSDASYTLLALPSPPPIQPHGASSSSTSPPPTPPGLLLLSHSPSQPLQPSHLSPTSFFDPSSPLDDATPFKPLPDLKDSLLGLSEPVREFFRTPNGRGAISLGERGECVAWGLDGSLSAKGKSREGVWKARARWQAEEGVELMALFARGRSIATYVPSTSTVSISYLRPAAGAPLLQVSRAMPLPGLSPNHRLSTLIALSDVDDGVSTPTTLPTTSYLFASTSTGWVYVWRLDAGDPTRRGEKEGEPTPTLVSSSLLPFRNGADDTDEPAFVMSVDPMGWHQSVIDWKQRTPLQDMLVVVKKDGELSYWTPRLGEDGKSGVEGREPWVRTGVVKTGKKDVVLARCSSRKKTAMVVSTPDGNQLSIWDSKSSEFYSGMEFISSYGASSPVNDLDWTTTADLQSVLAVGFKTHVVLLAEQRMSYVEEGGAYWDTVLRVDIGSLTPNPITDSIWLANGSFAVAAGNQVFIHSRFLARSPDDKATPPRDVFEMVALGNGPVVDYHPQLLVQCMLWKKIELVKSIVTRLHLAIEGALNRGEDAIDWPRMDVSEFFGAAPAKKRDAVKVNGAAAHSRYTSLFDDDPEPDHDDGNGFTRSLVSNLIEHLEGPFPLLLSRHEREHLITLVQTLLEIDEQQRALDVNGLRYLISLRFYVIWQNRLPPSGTLTPESGDGTTVTHSHHHKERLSFRNVVWALHSQSQDILLTAATAASGGKMMLANAKALGVFLWLRSAEVLRTQVEVVARNQYMQGDDRDPASCSLLYFALGKVKLVHGLWKQAAWHPEQKVMLKFLANDFDQPRWKTAALKNAFALLSKQRHEYAAAFFLLGGSVKDAVNVCLKQLNDWQLAVAIARVVEGDDGPVLRSILQNTVVPLAFGGGHRWLGTWAFWMLRRRDLAVRILVTPLKDLQPSVDFAVPVVGDSHDDDPSLALLFSQLRSLTLQTAKGTSEIPEQTEFNFVLHNARVFTRMGCHVLALDLVRSWTFLRPDVLPKSLPPTAPATPSNTSSASSDDGDAEPVAPLPRAPSFSSDRPPLGGSLRRPSFLLGGGRRQSILIDMDLPASGPPTRATSPVPVPPPPTMNGDGEKVEEKKVEGTEKEKKKAEEEKPVVLDQAAIARAKGLGSLMKSAKEDAKQGAAEFDMSAFGF